VTSLAAEQQRLRLVNQPRSLWRGTRQDVRDVYEHRELLRALVARDLRSRYKGSRLGWIWALVRPLVMLFIYGLAIGVFLGAARAIPDFMIFIYSGLLAWTLFSTIVMGSINSVVANGPLLTRASFPRVLLPLSVLAAALVDFALQASVLTIGYLFVGDWPGVVDLVWLPRALIVLVLLALGTGMALAAVNVYVRDIGFLTDVGLQVGFWMVPIIYSYGQVQRGAESFGWSVEVVTRLYMLNPMANVVLAFQRALWPPASQPEAAAFAFPGRLDLRIWVCTALALVVAWAGLRIYVKLSGNFGQEL
jgi:ABC-2 type transport system permease protein